MESQYQENQGYQWLKINVDARRALSIIFLNLRFLLILLIFATHRSGNMSAARHQGNQGHQWLKINVDARRASYSFCVVY